MAIICIRLDADEKLVSDTPQPSTLLCRASDETAHKMGDYRDILSLTRVLVCGPKSKSDVDSVIERYAILADKWKFAVYVWGPRNKSDLVVCYSFPFTFASN